MKASLYFDGGARPTNPGHSGCGVLVQCGRKETEVGRYLGWKTNNEAEYIGLIVSLKIARDLGATELVITGDSMLVINTVGGDWKTKKPHLRLLVNEAKALLETFEEWEFVHVRGHMGHVENERVDTLCTNAILFGMKKNPFSRVAEFHRPDGKIVDPFQ